MAREPWPPVPLCLPDYWAEVKVAETGVALQDALSMATASVRRLAVNCHGGADSHRRGRLPHRDGDSRAGPGHRYGPDWLRHRRPDRHGRCRVRAVRCTRGTENGRNAERDDQCQAQRRGDRQQALREGRGPGCFAVAPARPRCLRRFHSVDGRPGRCAPGAIPENRQLGRCPVRPGDGGRGRWHRPARALPGSNLIRVPPE